MVEEDGTPVLDKLDGPFFDYILDHPLFHYNCLNADLKNLNGIFLDEAQEAYVKRYYPRVKKTLTMPLGATEAVTGGKRRRQTPFFSWERMTDRTKFTRWSNCPRNHCVLI